MKFKARKYIFFFRLFAIVDVMFADKFELIKYNRAGVKLATTKFDKEEIINAWSNEKS